MTKSKAKEMADKISRSSRGKNAQQVDDTEVQKMIKDEWIESYARDPVRTRMLKVNPTDRVGTIPVPNTEYVDFSKPCTRNLTKFERESRDADLKLGLSYIGAHDVYTAAYYEKDGKIVNPITYREASTSRVISAERMMRRPMQHGDVIMVHYQPQVFDDSLQNTNGVTNSALEVHFIKYNTTTNGLKPSLLCIEGAQDFPIEELEQQQPKATPSTSTTTTTTTPTPQQQQQQANIPPIVGSDDGDLIDYDYDDEDTRPATSEQ